MKMEKWDIETISGMGEGRIKENDGGVNSTMIYYKTFWKSHNVPPVQNIIFLKKNAGLGASTWTLDSVCSLTLKWPGY
jgi:hypothetical protein